jgi:hypothetical protein
MNSLLRGRSLINILIISLIFIIVFFIFVAVFLIPAGKTYKKDHKIYRQVVYDRDMAQDHHDETLINLKELQTKNRNIILAYGNLFDPDAFAKRYKGYFKRLRLTAVDVKEPEDIFDIYEVNATSDINSPTDFYEFLDAVNKSENIISIEFPINFVADGSVIRASFKLKVFGADFDNQMSNKDANITIDETLIDSEN